jgi:hypothetical protein
MNMEDMTRRVDFLDIDGVLARSQGARWIVLRSVDDS